MKKNIIFRIKSIYFRKSFLKGVNVHSISIINQKGGCGKTTFSIALASYLAKIGFRVLLVDFDSQHNTTNQFIRPFVGRVVPNGALDYKKSDILIPTIDTFIEKGHPFGDGIVETDFGFSIYPSTHYLVSVEKEEVLDNIGKLNDGIEDIKNDFDFLIFDTPPLIENLVTLALYASNFYIVPLSADIFAFEGFSEMQTRIMGRIRRLMPNPVEYLGCVVTSYKKAHDMARLVKESAKNFPQFRTFKNQFNYSACYQKASLNSQTVYEQVGNYKALLNLEALGQEILDRIKESGNV